MNCCSISISPTGKRIQLLHETETELLVKLHACDESSSSMPRVVPNLALPADSELPHIRRGKEYWIRYGEVHSIERRLRKILIYHGELCDRRGLRSRRGRAVCIWSCTWLGWWFPVILLPFTIQLFELFVKDTALFEIMIRFEQFECASSVLDRIVHVCLDMFMQDEPGQETE